MYRQMGKASQVKEQVVGVRNTGMGEYPNGKAAEVKYGCDGGAPADAPYIARLQCDLANSYYWTGKMSSDYVFFVCNWHPWLGLLFSHPNHPWSKFERLLMQIVSLSISIVPAALIATSVGPGLRQIFTLAFVTLPNIIYGVILYQCAIAATRCWVCMAPCFKCCRNCVFSLTLGACVSASLVAYTIMTAEHHPHWQKLLTPLVMGQVYSQIMWFPLWIILPCQLGFCSLWKTEQRAWGSFAASQQQP